MTLNGAVESQAAQARTSLAIDQLATADGRLAGILADLTAVVAEEAFHNAVFRARLSEALSAAPGQVHAPPADDDVNPVASTPKRASSTGRPRRGRRAPGPWDPYAVYADFGEAGLKDKLNQLQIDQLRDIIAEHGMNNDGLALRWVKPERVIGRIVERVIDRAAKGDAFRRE